MVVAVLFYMACGVKCCAGAMIPAKLLTRITVGGELRSAKRGTILAYFGIGRNAKVIKLGLPK